MDADMLTPAWAIALHAGEFAEDQNTFTECINGDASIDREFSVLSRHAMAFSFFPQRAREALRAISTRRCFVNFFAR
jgi:hypothetical protein